MDFIEGEIDQDFATLEDLLVDRENNIPKPKDEAFPMIEDLDTCNRCFYRELCGR